MAEFGFAVLVSQKDLVQDRDGTMESVRRLLIRNYKESKEREPQLGKIAPLLLRGTCTTDDGYGEIPFAWYVDTERSEHPEHALSREGEEWFLDDRVLCAP